MRWERLGHLEVPGGMHPWAVSHASVPVVDPMEGDLFRVYYSVRDADGRSWTTSCVVDLAGAPRLVESASEPCLKPGNAGMFDDRGAMACWLVGDATPRQMYYIGWNTGTTVPFRNAIGIAHERGVGEWEKAGEGPLLDRNPVDPYFLASCCVVRDGEEWVMWYTSCTEWEPVGGSLRHRYLIKHATSPDGITWIRTGRIAIGYADGGEYAISRPSVLRDRDLWHMWYSYRGDRYRIGYAQSRNGLDWTRMDPEGGLWPQGTAWESEMVEYGHVFTHRDELYMVYNGNGYGLTGLGVARRTIPTAMVP